MMNDNNKYSAANLDSGLVKELKTFEDKLSQQSQKDLVVVAYEKENRPE
jgi:hypothetical protein